MVTATDAAAAGPSRASGWAPELRATLALAWPLIVAQLATIALTATDVVMMGWLGPEFLAAGSLSTAGLYPFLMFGTGVVTATAPMISQAVGGRRRREVRRAARQGIWAAAAAAALLAPAMLMAEPLFLALGQTPRIAALAGSYLTFAAWMFPPALVFVALRSLVASHGETRVVLLITLVGIGVNALGNWALMFGNFGFPRLELRGAGISTAVVHLTMATLLALYVALRGRYRRYRVFARLWRADWPRFRAVWRLGTPIGLTMAAESGLFAAAAVLMGVLGPDELAAHAVALQLIAIAFMVPMGLSHATSVRVGLAYGAGDAAGVRRAGWVSVLLAGGFMVMTALVLWLAPRPLISIFLALDDPANAVPVALATGYLAVAALFQLVDGVQVTAAAALRGLSDTTAPMAIALFGYWALGMPVAWGLGFVLEMRGVGVWLGLAAGLACTAVVLAARFAIRSARL